MSIEQAFNYRRVNDEIATAGFLTPEQLKLLGPAGYQIVINLLPDSSEYATADERAIVESQGIEYLYLPIDFAAPTPEEYDQFKTLMKQAEGRKLLIHCAANYRVSAFYSRYAIDAGEWTADEADEFMRSIWQPEDYVGWPEWLDAVERRSKNG